MENQKKISTLIGIIIILVLVIAVFGGVLMWGKSATKDIETKNEVSQNVEIANWKTYTNTEYGFEIKIPNDYNVDSTQGLTFRSYQVEQKFIESTKECENSDRPGVCIGIAKENIFDIASFVSQQSPTSCSPNYCAIKEAINIGGTIWNRLYYQKYGDGSPAYWYFMLNNGKYYSFVAYEYNQKLLEQMLLTFKIKN